MEKKLFDPVKTYDLPTPVKYSSMDYVVATMKKELKQNRRTNTYPKKAEDKIINKYIA
jgi:hypothetical protein